MIKFIFYIFILFSFPVFASDSTGFFTSVYSFLEAIYTFFVQDIPDMFNRFFAWLVTYFIYLKITGLVWALEFSNSIALSLVEALSITEVINTSVSSLPVDIRNVAIEIGFFDGLTLVIEGFLTRIVYSTIN